MTDLIQEKCRCGAVAMLAPGSSEVPLCMDCRRKDCGVTWTGDRGIGKWHPTVGYASPGQGPLAPEAVSEAAPVPPEVTSRDPWPEGISVPKSVAALQKLAMDNGWNAVLGYSRRDVEQLISVRVRRPGIEAHAIYRTASGKSWSWAQFWVTLDERFPRQIFLLADFQAVLMEGWKAEPEALLAALRDFATIHANGVDLAKRRTKVRAEIRQMGNAGKTRDEIDWMASSFYTPEEVTKILAMVPKNAKSDV